MTMDTKVLIIENQWSEFEKICETLSSNCYNVLLDENVSWSSLSKDADKEGKFISLATRIRIWVDKDHGYVQTYRDMAFELIHKLAEQANIIIIDHILGGSYSCLTGIDLAKELVEKISFQEMPPVLFVSKTEHTEKKRLDAYDEYMKFIVKQNIDVNAHTKWVHKGYFGDEILQPEYIKKYVIEEGIEELLNNQQNQQSSISAIPLEESIK
ncbi:hypothetical protein FACS1894155_05030 [Bacteroidia bacterium]|nr:hypothetical protein FACS1894155_05030 [Bacteroidia bacterium]